MPVFEMTEENFLFHEDWDVFRFGRNLTAIDIMTKMGDLNFDSFFNMANLYPVEGVEGVEIKLVHYTHLIKAKQAAGRFKDLNDLENLPKQI